MSTPTPHQPTSAPRHGAPTSTPAAHNLAIGATPTTNTPRSIASPAVVRGSHAVKTPSSAHKLGGAAMAPSLSQLSNKSTGDSNSGLGSGLGGADMIRGASGLGMGLGMGISPGMLAGLDIGTPSLLDAAGLGVNGGQPMSISLSDLGVPNVKRNDDEERKSKLEGVLGSLLGKRKRGSGTSGMGRVSDEGVRRVGRWAGFDVEVEAKWEGKEFEGNRPIMIAGRNAVLIEMSFKDNIPKKIEVAFSSENEAVTAHQADAANVLLDNLVPIAGISAINTKLDLFAQNLQALARLDKLSSPQLNCVEAVTGIYTSLLKLYNHEREAAETLFDVKGEDLNRTVEHEVITKKSGKPAMHSNGRVGLNIDYWMAKNSNGPRKGIKEEKKVKAEPSDDAMDIDDKKKSQASPTSNELYSLEITVEPSDSDMYPSIRNPTTWISDRIMRPKEEMTDAVDLLSTTPVLDWQDPPANNPNPASSDSPSTHKEPSGRFVAQLHPPIVVPYTIAATILQQVGLTTMPSLTPDAISPYETMLLRPAQTPITSTINVSIPGPEMTEVVQNYTLHSPRPEYGFTLTSIPFAHPRQIIALLPVLRQWAALGSLLRSAFPSVSKPISSSTPGEGKNEMNIDVTLTTPMDLSLPSLPNLTFFFPCTGKEDVAWVTASIGPEGEIQIVDQNLVSATDDSLEKEIAIMAKGLEVCGGVGVWLCWLCKRFT